MFLEISLKIMDNTCVTWWGGAVRFVLWVSGQNGCLPMPHSRRLVIACKRYGHSRLVPRSWAVLSICEILSSVLSRTVINENLC